MKQRGHSFILLLSVLDLSPSPSALFSLNPNYSNMEIVERKLDGWSWEVRENKRYRGAQRLKMDQDMIEEHALKECLLLDCQIIIADNQKL